jgi:hypothetical protein
MTPWHPLVKTTRQFSSRVFTTSSISRMQSNYACQPFLLHGHLP